jgi:hypothetical protein
MVDDEHHKQERRDKPFRVAPRTTKALADLAIYKGFINAGGGRI